ncbi:MAG: filamentous hemagglutinin N-terminal domain-containing protein [Simkaniaceae bacterium]|nr:MAG: filamentous hemagglutinin N-terminal domain-containing protein [Simkaniaceae bacterium]
MFLFFNYGHCHPSSPDVVHGQAQFLKDKNQLIIQTQSDKTIINWDAFSIDSGEVAHFLQPHETSATLNRVLSQSPSTILGSLTSNGVLFLINPNGILVGPGGSIDVNGLIASTLDIQNAEFLNGDNLDFLGSSDAAIENLGLIKGGGEGVYLIGRHLINKGNILAVSSEVHFGAGSHILLKTDDRHIYIQPDLEGISEGVGADLEGTVEAVRIEVHADGNLYDLAIRHSAKTKALALAEKGGEIYLVAKDGEVYVQDESHLIAQKQIEVLGEKVALTGQAYLEIQEEGEILIGGSPKRMDSDSINATHTFFGSDVLVNANGSESGDSGNVTIFATGRAGFFGKVQAKGGQKGGDGGIVEVSGFKDLVFNGIIETEATNGYDGLLILDPTNITISGGATAGGTFDGGSPLNTFSTAFTAAAATLNNTALSTALQTNDVLVTTTSGFGSAGNITIGAATTLNLATSHTLTLQADNNITISSSLTMSGPPAGTTALSMIAGNDITLTSAVTGTNLASMSMAATGDILIDNAVSAPGATLTMIATGNVVSQGVGTNSITANQCMISAGAGVTITNDIIFTGGGSASALSITAGTTFAHNNIMTFNNWGTATASSVSGNFLVDQQARCTGVGTLTFNGGVDLINQGTTNLFNDLSGNNTDLFFNANRDVVINSQIDINNFKSCTIQPARDFDLNHDFEPDNTTTVTVNAGRDIVHVGGSADVIANNVTTLSFIAANNFTSTRPFTTTNVATVNITAISGDVAIGIGGTTNVNGSNATVTAGNNISLATTFRNNTSGDITFSAVNDVNIGPSTILAQVGTRNGLMKVTSGRDLNVVGGGGSNDRSQIGFNNAVVTSDIDLTVGRDINVTAGGSTNSIAHIGHGFATAGNYTGDIIINSVGRNVTLMGDAGPVGSIKFAQIGHTRFSGASVSSFTGDIRGTAVGSPASISGTLRLVGGTDTTCFALFGHGGRDSNSIDTYSGNIRVHANEIDLSGGTSTDCFANIGFFAVAQTAGINPVTIASPSSVQAISDTVLTMTANTNGIVSIGGRVLNTAAHLCSMDIDSVDIQTGGNLVMTSGTGIETDATIGAFSNFGICDTNLSMTIGGDLLINAGTGAVAQIVNGSGATAALKNITIQVTGNITPSVAGVFAAFIENPTGNLDVAALGTITLPSLTRISNVGASSGTLNVNGGSIAAFSGGNITNNGGGATSAIATLGDLSVSDTSMVSSVGNLVSAARSNLIVFDNASITSSAGTLQASAGEDITALGTAGGSAFFSSASTGIYTAGRNISLRGLSAVNDGLITNTGGDLTLIAGANIEINAFGKVETAGPGILTLVVDNLFPVSPGIGFGEFNLATMGTVSALGGGPIRIFTARRDQNMIVGIGNINGSTYVPGPLFVDSATEQWETYYPSSVGGAPFTLFYKDGLSTFAGPPTDFDILGLNPNAFVPFYELSYILEGYRQDPVFAWLYILPIENKWCKREKKEEGKHSLCETNILNITRLPPYMHRTSPIEF